MCVREDTGAARWAAAGFARPNDVAWTHAGPVVSEWRGRVRTVADHTAASRHPRVGRLAMLHYVGRSGGVGLLFACDDAFGVVHVFRVE